MEPTKKVIKRTYDQYKPQDFSFGSDNLNPTREMLLDSLDRVEKVIQEVTDNIVLKKLQPKQEDGDAAVKVAKNESPAGSSFAGKMKALKTGTLDGYPFDDVLPEEYKAQLVEALAMLDNIDELTKPPVIECEHVFKKYSFDTAEPVVVSYEGIDFYDLDPSEDEDDDDDDDEDDEDEDGSGDGEDEDEEENPCDEIELAWLKIILIICNVIKVIKIIIEYVLSILAQVVQVVCLAVGAWINPPNIAQIVGIIMAIVMSVIAKIIAYLLKLLFDLLNMDCLSDSVLQTMDKIIEAISSFNSMMGLLDAKTVSLLGGLDLNASLNSAKDLIKDLLKSKGEAWEQMVQDLKDTFSDENLEKLKNEAVDTAINAALETMADYGDNAEIYSKAKEIIYEAQTAYDEVKRVNDQARQAIIDGQQAAIKFSASSSSPDPAFSMLNKGFIVSAEIE